MTGRAADRSNAVEAVERGELGSEAVSAWRRLALLRGNPFASPDWLDACVEGGAVRRPVVLVARDREGGYAGFLALERFGVGPLRGLRVPGHNLGDWYEPACDREGESGFLSACAEALPRIGCEVLALDRWGGAVEPLSEAELRPRRSRPDDSLPFVELGAGGWDEYLAGRSRNFRSQLGRRRRKLENGPGLEFRRADHGSLEADWDTFVGLHGARWGAKGESGVLTGAGAQVHRSFARRALEQGWLRLWVMSVGGRPVGAWYGWRLGDRYGYQLSGFDPAMSDAGIGTVLLAHTIEAAAGEGVGTYDLLWGDEPYKARFETDRRTVPSLLLTRPRSLASVVTRSGVGLRSAGRRLPGRLRRALKR